MSNHHNLKDTARKALWWSFVDKFGQQTVYALSGVVLARLLSPHEYALLGMLVLFIALSNVLLDSGFGSYFIQKQEATNEDYTSFFFFNVVVSTALYGLLYFLAPWIARFYSEPLLVDLARILFLAIIFNGLGVTHNMLLTKKMAFGLLAKVNFLALFLASVFAVMAAWFHMGVWALIVQVVLLALFKTLFLWGVHAWRPHTTPSIRPLREAFSFSAHMLSYSVINAVFNNIYSVVIGKFYKSHLGNFIQGNKYQEIPTSLLFNTYRNVALPLFSSVNKDVEQTRKVLAKTLRSMAFLNYPLVCLLYLIATPFIHFLIGEKWSGAIPFFRIMVLSAFFVGFSTIFNELLVSRGKSRTVLRVELVRRVLLAVIIACTFRLGIEVMLYGWVLYSFINMIITWKLVSRVLDVSFSFLFKQITVYCLLAITVAVVTSSLYFIPIHFYLQMFVQIAIYILLYLGGSYFWGLKEAKETIDSCLDMCKRITKK